MAYTYFTLVSVGIEYYYTANRINTKTHLMATYVFFKEVKIFS